MKFTKRESKESDGSGANFLKIKPGEAKNVIFRGEIFEFRIVWENNKSIVVPSADPSTNNRFKANVILYEEGRFIAKTWEFGVTVYNDLASINEEYDLSKTKVKITRHGKGTDTTYNILPLLKEPIPPGVMKEIEAVTLNILDKPGKPQGGETVGPFSGEEPEVDLPF